MLRSSSSTKHSPLTSIIPRHAGQSLDEARATVLEDVGILLATSGAAIIMAMVEGVQWILNEPPHPIPFIVIAILMTVYTGYRLRRGMAKRRALRLGRDGEREVALELEALTRQGYRVLHDIPGPRFNLDHVVIGPGGVWTIETKTRSKARGNPKIVFDGTSLMIDGRGADPDPIRQAQWQAHWLDDVFKACVPDLPSVHPMVVFPGWFVENTRPAGHDSVDVLNPKQLIYYIQGAPRTLSDATVSMLAQYLTLYSAKLTMPVA